MEAATQNRISVSALPDRDIAVRNPPRAGAATLAFQTGAWVSGIEAFFANDALSTGAIHDFAKPLRVSRSALQKASHLCFILTGELEKGATLTNIDSAAARLMHGAIRKPLSLCDSMLTAAPLGQDVWIAWKTFTIESLTNCPAFPSFVAAAESDGIDFLPRKLRELLANHSDSADALDLDAVLPRFGTILRLLDLVGEMLERDEPLRASLIIFAKVADRVREMIAHVNQRVLRAGDDLDGMMGVLDGASYMTSIELRKVLQQELFGVVALRPATTVYARNETAYALLTESLQQILASFARQVDSNVDIFALFPSFRSKLEQSVVLRRDLHALGELTRETEKSTDAKSVERLTKELNRFMEKSVRYLFYKDIETFERFVEEILENKNQKDLTALLHRFAAYVETLFGQVCLRAILEHHPFENPKP